ncbi:MAG: carboxypeptidase-like regulatory domain-containing protein [Bacteroidales bacterium]|nr:carboxypeptidase-like regulatory domain-containing protein [Bacteroidales bacterium]
MKSKLTKAGIAIISVIVICGITLFTSCRNVQIFPERIEIVERTIDHSLRDSAVIYGYVLDAFMKEPLWRNPSVILVTQTGTTTLSDSTGFYSIKLLPGTYTIEVFCSFSTVGDTLRLENLNLLPNERVKIKFFKRVEIG